MTESDDDSDPINQWEFPEDSEDDEIYWDDEEPNPLRNFSEMKNIVNEINMEVVREENRMFEWNRHKRRLIRREDKKPYSVPMKVVPQAASTEKISSPAPFNLRPSRLVIPAASVGKASTPAVSGVELAIHQLTEQLRRVNIARKLARSESIPSITID